MTEILEQEEVRWLKIQAWNTLCNISYGTNWFFLTLNKKWVHSTLCLWEISWYTVSKTSDNKLYLQTLPGWEVVTFFQKFPNVNFFWFWSDLLSDIWWIREDIVPKVLELV